MTALMLTPDELERLTGRKRPTAQAAYLKRNGLRYRINDSGEVIVARVIGESFLGVPTVAPANDPDLDWRAMGRLGIVSPGGEA